VRWQPDSGQVVFDFERAGAPEPPDSGATVTPLVQARAAASAPPPTNEDELSAQELYERGCAVEESAPAKAQQLYRQAVAKDTKLADAHINLGRLMHEAGEVHAALVHYRAALDARAGDPTAAFNVGVALEDLGSLSEAIQAYQQSITCDPANADAHYNVARLLEQTGKPEMAIRHLLIYRQLTRRK
jgi:tetratricopeptide (TPR) repeat protein